MSEVIERKAYTINDFAKAYSLGRTKLWELIKAGEIRAVKVGARKVLIPASEGARLLAQLGE